MRTMGCGYDPEFWVDRLLEELEYGPGLAVCPEYGWAWEFWTDGSPLALLWRFLPSYVIPPDMSQL